MIDIDVCKLCPEELVLFATTTAIELAKGKNCEELVVISTFFSQICCTLGTIKCQRLFKEKACKNKKDVK